MQVTACPKRTNLLQTKQIGYYIPVELFYWFMICSNIFLDFYDLTQEPIPELIQNTKALIDAARQSNIPVVYTAQPGNQSPEYRQLLTDFWGLV